MMYRDDPGGRLAIGQPAHAWVCGQLARAWGNARFGAVTPWEEVCLAAEQHDVGMAAWDSAPTRNPATGRPYSFMEMPTPVHLALWRAAKSLTLPQSRYAALLASLHGTGLYERRNLANDPPEIRAAVEQFLSDERAYQSHLIDSLRADPHYAAHATPEAITRNRALIRAWDALSLALCVGARERTVADVPTADATPATLALTAMDESGLSYQLAPWPFQPAEVSLTVDGRRLPGSYDGDAEMAEALAEAPWATLRLRLRPG